MEVLLSFALAHGNVSHIIDLITTLLGESRGGGGGGMGVAVVTMLIS